MRQSEQILNALGDVGSDLIDMAEYLPFAKSPWRRLAPLAACLAVLAGLGAAVFTWLPRQAAVPSPQEAAPPAAIDKISTEAPAPEETDAAADVWTPDPLPFYVLRRSDGIVGPAAAVDGEGHILVETEQGSIAPLIDQATGDYLAIVADHRPDTVPQADNRLSIYDLQGGFLQDVTAWNIECLGSVIIVSYADHAALYSRPDGRLLRADLASARIWSDYICAVPQDGSAQYLLLDGTGAVTAQVPLDQTDEGLFAGTSGSDYLLLRNQAGLLGLLDKNGIWALPQIYDDILGISHNYALCRLDETWYAVDLATGETALEWPWYIYEVFDDMAIVKQADYSAIIIDRQGNPLTEAANVIRCLDDEGDGIPERFALYRADLETCFYTKLDGSPPVEICLTGASVDEITSRTAICARNTQAEDGAWFMDVALIDLETGQETRCFDKPYTYGFPIWLYEHGQTVSTGLFYAEYQDADGEYHTDLLREDGTLLLEDLADQHCQQGDVFELRRSGQRILARLDGSILYQEPAEAD